MWPVGVVALPPAFHDNLGFVQRLNSSPFNRNVWSMSSKEPRVGLIEHELAAAETAWKEGNDGKSRVCARRAVARATEEWSERIYDRRWHGDAMEHLRQIQQDASLLLPSAKRLND